MLFYTAKLKGCSASPTYCKWSRNYFRCAAERRTVNGMEDPLWFHFQRRFEKRNRRTVSVLETFIWLLHYVIDHSALTVKHFHLCLMSSHVTSAMFSISGKCEWPHWKSTCTYLAGSLPKYTATGKHVAKTHAQHVKRKRWYMNLTRLMDRHMYMYMYIKFCQLHDYVGLFPLPQFCMQYTCRAVFTSCW